MLRFRSHIIVLIATLLLLPACIHTFREVKPRELSPVAPPVEVNSPIKVHLLDGRIALFQHGASFSADSLHGYGRIYDLKLGPDTTGAQTGGFPLTAIAALETYDERIRGIETLVVSSAASVGAAFGMAVALVAIFGSCPTIYTDVDGVRLQAESFPNSIVPLFEMRDVDLLQLRRVDEDTLQLEIRNEALETHYINHVELLEVVHPHGTNVVPDNDGIVRLMRDMRRPGRAVDRSGRDVLPVLSAQDDRQYASSPEMLQASGGQYGAAESGLEVEPHKDYIDLTVTSPTSDTAAVYLRLRNSLLGSVYFYDFMLDQQGANALNWLSEDLNSVAGAIELGGFYKEHMGLRVELFEGGAYREVGRVREVGPIAFDHVVVPVTVPEGDSLRLRLKFITDAWRIDHVAVGALERDADVRTVPASYVRGDWEVADLRHPDENYAVTSAGDHFWVGFPLSEVSADSARTLLVATQGYYTEWIRGKWVQDDVRGEPFEPSVASLEAAIERWIAVKDEFEARFDATKIPVGTRNESVERHPSTEPTQSFR